ncbi:MAG: hypothetical protein Kow0099_05510 [Candidatus Abyssubacteria bacterium]
MKMKLCTHDVGASNGRAQTTMNGNRDNPLNLEPAQLKELEDLIARLKRDMISAGTGGAISSSRKSRRNMPEGVFKETERNQPEQMMEFSK